MYGGRGNPCRRFFVRIFRFTPPHKNTSVCPVRLAAGLSPSQLSKITGISVRTIPQYGQSQKDISKAGTGYGSSSAGCFPAIRCCRKTDRALERIWPVCFFLLFFLRFSVIMETILWIIIIVTIRSVRKENGFPHRRFRKTEKGK